MLHSSLTLLNVAINVERRQSDVENRHNSALYHGEHEPADPIETHMLQALVADATERTKVVDFKAKID